VKAIIDELQRLLNAQYPF